MYGPRHPRQIIHIKQSQRRVGRYATCRHRNTFLIVLVNLGGLHIANDEKTLNYPCCMRSRTSQTIDFYHHTELAGPHTPDFTGRFVVTMRNHSFGLFLTSTYLSHRSFTIHKQHIHSIIVNLLKEAITRQTKQNDQKIVHVCL